MAHLTELLDTPPPAASALVRQFRQLLGLTQEQFAARMGVTLVTINRWENDRSKPSPLALLRIKTMLQELAQSCSGTEQTIVQELLSRYFSEEPRTAETQRVKGEMTPNFRTGN
jgi:putative transcriptional regulator